MPGLYAPDGGVNRLPKKWITSVGGVNKELKELYGVAAGVNRKVFSAEPNYTITITNNFPSYMDVGLTQDGYLYLSRIKAATMQYSVDINVTFSDEFVAALPVGLDIINNDWQFNTSNYYASFIVNTTGTSYRIVKNTNDGLDTGHYDLPMLDGSQTVITTGIELSLYCSSTTSYGGSIYGRFTLTSPSGQSIIPHS